MRLRSCRADMTSEYRRWNWSQNKVDDFWIYRGWAGFLVNPTKNGKLIGRNDFDSPILRPINFLAMKELGGGRGLGILLAAM